MQASREPVEASAGTWKQTWTKRVPLAAVFASLCFAASAGAEVTLDDSFGNDGQSILPEDLISDIMLDDSFGNNGQPIFPEDRIYDITDDFGQYSNGDSNLFHSFSAFTIKRNHTARFSATKLPANVIARVTGDSKTFIEGLLQSTIEGAHFFLLNPNGIEVRDGAKLDVRGSLHLTTADELKFEDGPSFDQDPLEPDMPSLVSAAEPSAFGFTSSQPKPISLAGPRLLRVPKGEVLSIVGGDPGDAPEQLGVSIIGNNGESSQVDVGNGTLQIAAAKSPVDIPVRLEELDVDALEPGQLGDVVVENFARLEAGRRNSGENSGRILIRAERFILTTRSGLSALNDTAAEPGANVARGIDVEATGRIEISSRSEIVTSADDGRAGDIRLAAPTIEVLGSSVVSKSEDAAERGGDIWLGSIDTPAHLVHVSDLGRIASEHTASSGAGGDVHISAANVELERGGQIFARTTGAGDSGNVTLHDADRVSVLGWEDGRNITAIATLADSAASGRGGDLEIHTRLLEVQDAGEIQTRTLGVGSAGDTLIVASERVTIQGGKNGFAIVSAGSSTPDLAAVGGKGGTLTIKAPVLELLDGGSVTTSIKGPGSGGQLNVFADRIEISGQSGESRSGLFSQSNSQVLGTPPDGMEEEWGRAGNIFVEVGELALGAGGRISAETDGPGDGGSIEITAEREISLTGAADISALSRGEGAAGEVRIDAGKSLTLVERSKITTEAKQSRGGKITIQARELVYLVDSEITTEVDLGADKGGDVLIDPDFVVLDNGDVIARADRGDGGAITIVADHLFRSEGSDIDPSSERGGLDGELVVEPPETEVIGQLTTLETSLVDASSLLTTPCAARTAPAGSFVVSGRSPLAASPDAPLSWLDVAGLDGFAPAGSVCPAQATP